MGAASNRKCPNLGTPENTKTNRTIVSVGHYQTAYDIFSHITEARSYAFGAQADVEGVFNNLQVDLQSIWQSAPFGQHDFHYHFWHSAQFRGDNAMQMSFWGTLLGRDGFKLK